jgi:hypothetical protein
MRILLVLMTARASSWRVPLAIRHRIAFPSCVLQQLQHEMRARRKRQILTKSYLCWRLCKSLGSFVTLAAIRRARHSIGDARFYPPEIRTWIDRHGGLTPQLVTMRGRDLTALYPFCP